MHVDGAMFIAGMEEQLLIARQAGHANTVKRTAVEGFWRIVELPAAEVGLTAVTGWVENYRVNVYPTAALSDQFHTYRLPVSLHAIASALQNAQRDRLVACVQRQVKVTMESRLSTYQCIDAPTAGDPNGATGLGQVGQHPKHLAKIHALDCSVWLHHRKSQQQGSASLPCSNTPAVSDEGADSHNVLPRGWRTVRFRSTSSTSTATLAT
jgi:hypothetical protein